MVRKIGQAFIVYSALFWLLPACKKQYPSSSSLLQDAKAFFTSQVESSGSPNSQNYRAGIPKTVLWDQATIISLSIGNGVFIPVQYQTGLFVKSTFGGDHPLSLNYLTQLLLYRDIHHTFHAALITTLPDSNYLSNPSGIFRGFRFIEDWNGNLIAKYFYKPDGTILKLATPRIQTDATITVCNVITGYNYAPSTNDFEDWTETAGCTEMYIPDDIGEGEPSGGDYGGGGGGVGTATVYIKGPTNPIKDIKQYFGCFTNTPGSTYKVTVCVDQPYPGKRTPWAVSVYNAASGYSHMINPGHTFFVFTQVQTGGATITRSVGFYPSGFVNPFVPSIQGVLNNDEDHDYDISGGFSTNSTLFFNMLNYVSQGNTAGYLYNVNSNNCTTFALNALAAGHIYLPSTTGGWPGGSGNDPGDLGEDLRGYNITGMSRNTTDLPHPNAGSCN